MSNWTPYIRLDLSTANSRAFSEMLEEFEAWRAAQPRRKLDLTNGWKTITPEIAEGMLLCNPLTANRKPTMATVQYYARQMLKGDWKKTGQPVIFTRGGTLLDAGHRLWACYLSESKFETYVIGDVEDDQENIFAYIDNGKARSAADALATAGLNGQSKLLAQVVNISALYEGDCYTASGKKHLDRLSPIEVIAYVTARPNMRTAARLMAGEHKSAAAIIGHKDVAAFAAYQILELHDEPTLDDFMTELDSVDEGDHAEGSPIAALQKVLDADKTAKETMAKHQVLGHLIKAFNSWVKRESVKKITLRVNEEFPRFLGPQPDSSEPIREAAE
jgi:hypothetical protein